MNITEDQINEMAHIYFNELERYEHFPVSESLILAYKAGMEMAFLLQPEWIPVAEFDFKENMNTSLYLFDGFQRVIGRVDNRGNFFY